MEKIPLTYEERAGITPLTYEEWRDRGYQVKKGEKYTCLNNILQPAFFRAQVYKVPLPPRRSRSSVRNSEV